MPIVFVCCRCQQLRLAASRQETFIKMQITIQHLSRWYYPQSRWLVGLKIFFRSLDML
ncbi:hypothetical protein JI435_409640 [Parastagonospora nodorum SN15]|uniref:Uncharacterized protein n=1 Tax=Phaeosphaeria nodorum (strain SN15 / ATCC MYA-4574 / FGSC 10173) TaxID=321614 RepID=A0A7U2F1C6_PHANO|nr:hypothetical protein JI435_409640 [Parastagonospora nodorum SN15]